MSIQNIKYRTPILLLIYLCGVSSVVWAQNEDCTATTLSEFFDCYGETETFSDISIQAINTFIQAEDAIHVADYAQAKTLIDGLFSTYPKGSTIWYNASGNNNGANVGNPSGYYGLRMMEDIVDYHLNNNQDVEARKVNMKVVLVGCSQGIQPTTTAELESGTGPFVENSLNESLLTDDYRIIKQAYDLFSRYVTAITGGQLDVEVEFIELPDVCMDVSVTETAPYFAYGSLQPAWEAISDAEKEETDFWMMLYPSHVPEFPDFENNSFITGGMGLSQNGGPVFIADDKWIVRKPAHLGSGVYSDIERRIYLPQWFQHEFFHHLYRIYPEYELEVNGHDWFDPSFWPSDFEGRFETDFYSESLHKRLQTDCVPLATKLITRALNEEKEQFSKLSIDGLIGQYSLDNIQNEWHVGEVRKQGSKYFWRNSANVQWEVLPNVEEGRLETGSDSPYPGQDFFIELYQTVEGDYIPGAVALKFQGDAYNKRFNMLRESIPVEITLGQYERIPTETTLHSGHIIKEAGQYYWENDAGNKWLLTPNSEDENFTLNSDSPTPGQKFELIIAEDECDSYILGFKYLGEFYWRSKNDQLNASPNLIDPIPDFLFIEAFSDFEIDLANVFSDPEGDEIFLFAKNEDPFVLTNVEGQTLLLSGNENGVFPITVIAIDANGGVAMDEFFVLLEEAVSSNDIRVEDSVLIFPNPSQDNITIAGELDKYDISILSIDGSFQKDLSASGQEIGFDFSSFPSGVYMIRFVDKDNGKLIFEKVVKY
ncbi:MAG: hypothetical protein ACJATI_004184 [Halioglobus sp.]|jgi:hypothetical protein